MSRRFATGTLLAVGLLAAPGLWSDAADTKPAAKKAAALAAKKNAPPAVNKPLAPPAPKGSLLTVEAWQKAPRLPMQPGEIDRLIVQEQRHEQITPAPRTSDEQFLRRVTLDLTGQLPLPADVAEFAADTDPAKRDRVVNKLLASDEYARHWARYWRDVIETKLTDLRGRALASSFEDWMFTQLKANKNWGEIARAMITADGQAKFDEPGKNGQLFFLVSRTGADGANERAAETSRLFLGIQIQCAQCHDHPYDQWKRVQFHELAAYFARSRERVLRESGSPRPVGIELMSLPRGEHEMPSKEDPKKTLRTNPRFLDGKAAGENLGDRERRRALAAAITDKNNYWFAGAYVNRVWGELMGQSFYQPVDDMGPQKEAVYAGVLTRLTGAFRGGNYDIKEMFRAILTSETYQRQIRLGDSADQHLHFAAAYPTRLRPDALWDSLVGVLGPIDAQAADRPRPMGGGLGAYLRSGFEGLFKEEFNFDPSLKPDEVEGNIAQALLMMNNPVLNQRIQARGTNLLARILQSYPRDDDALRMLYLRTLARKPTDREMDRCREHVQTAKSRAEAFEDILWALLNSTEFQTKR